MDSFAMREERWLRLLIALACLLVAWPDDTEMWRGLNSGCPVTVPPSKGPEVNVRAFGARGDGATDDTAAIEAAIRALPGGGTVMFPPGTYRHDRVLRVDAPGVILAGRGARLLAGDAAHATVHIAGGGSGIRDLQIATPEPGVRGDRDEMSGVLITGRNNTLLGVRVSGAKSAGILVLGAHNFLIACADVTGTRADGIHVSGGSAAGRVAFNMVRDSEDDGIAVVSYRKDRQSRGVIIEDNSVEQVRWGRGIAVIGSADVTVRRNTVRAIAMAAGIIVAREAFWNTHGARNVTIEDNRIFDVQQSLAPLNGRARTGQAAIDLNSDDDDPSLAVTDVTVASNLVVGSRFDGLRLNGNVTRVEIRDNAFRDVKSPIFIVRRPPAEMRLTP